MNIDDLTQEQWTLAYGKLAFEVVRLLEGADVDAPDKLAAWLEATPEQGKHARFQKALLSAIRGRNGVQRFNDMVNEANRKGDL